MRVPVAVDTIMQCDWIQSFVINSENFTCNSRKAERVVCLSVKSAEQIWIINSTRGKSYRLGVRFYQIWAIKLYLWTHNGLAVAVKLFMKWTLANCVLIDHIVTDRLSWLIYPLPLNAYVILLIPYVVAFTKWGQSIMDLQIS